MNDVGILLAISSLPGDFGIGDFNSAAYKFIDLLKQNKVKYWQILPLNPIGYGHSPYQPYSSFAFDEIYVDLYDLYERGLISKLPAKIEPSMHSDYEKAREIKNLCLIEAFFNYSKNNDNKAKILVFLKNNKYISEYCDFASLKEINENVSWKDWYQDSKKNKNYLEIRRLIHGFSQMILFEEWSKILAYAHKKGVQIIGDVPFYVGFDSSDVFYHKSNFLLDENDNPVVIAGVPPDYFSASGQRWGNPIYDWNYLKNTEYKFLIDRLCFASKIYDVVRIDHFRAFDSYWAIDPKCSSAIDGEWKFPPGYDFFNTLFIKQPNINLIAEDLGLLRDEVLELKNFYNLPGMRVMQFSLEEDVNPFTKKENTNTIYYSGTHDNDTLVGFVSKLDELNKSYLNNALISKGIKGETLEEKMINYALNREEKTVIIPVQDVLLLDSEFRMNEPGIINSVNWTFKLKDFLSLDKNIKAILNEKR